jgi:hypothetical protein
VGRAPGNGRLTPDTGQVRANPNETQFETAICDWLTEFGGYAAVKNDMRQGEPRDFDPERGLDTAELYSFFGATQIDLWHELITRYGGDPDVAQAKFADRLASELDKRRVVDVLRHGVVDQGVTLRLAYFRPAHGLTPELVKRWFRGLDDDEQDRFRDALGRFVRIYSFLSQIVTFADTFPEKYQEALLGRMDRNEKVVYRYPDDEDLRSQVNRMYETVARGRLQVAYQEHCPIGELLGTGGESAHLEYKSTLRTGTGNGEVVKALETASLKTIAALANSRHGGTLLIGVADDASVQGLPVDANVVVDKGGRLEKRSPSYVRVGNGTRAITDPAERQKYTADRWGRS